jgi:anti-sigma factor RsiW
MQMHTDEALVAYLDGELDRAARQEVDAWLDSDDAARERLLALAASASLVRSAFADILNEKVPDRLIAAARGETTAAPQEAEIIVLNRSAPAVPTRPARAWGIGFAAAAALFGLVIGGAGGYFGPGFIAPSSHTGGGTSASTADWLDNTAGFYKLVVSAGDGALVDVPATGDPGEALKKVSQSLPQQVRLPNLKPWGLTFRGARLVVGEGRPAAQLIYTTDNKAIGPLTLTIGATRQPDIAPTFDRRQDISLLYWRHQGRAYVLAGQTDIGYLWGIANDVAWQLDAI